MFTASASRAKEDRSLQKKEGEMCLDQPSLLYSFFFALKCADPSRGYQDDVGEKNINLGFVFLVVFGSAGGYHRTKT